MTEIPLDKKANIRIIRKLRQDGLLSEVAFDAARSLLRPTSVWLAWARRMLLFFGSALVLAGVVFFFAYNWTEMGRFLKFVLIEVGIVACIIAASLRGFLRLSGKVLLLSASVLVGVLLAVYGQIYQTGADAFELFIGWAVLIFGWVLVSEFAALWMVWIILLNTGAILYWEQVGHPSHSIPYGLFCLAIASFNSIALALYEVGTYSGLKWLSGRWFRSILLAGILVALSIPTLHVIWDLGGIERATLFAACGWGVAAVCGYACYRFKLHDMIPIALIVSNVCLILLVLIAKGLFRDTRGNGAGLFLLFSLIVLAVVSGAVFLLRNTAAKMAKGKKKVIDE
jgi:uncharacterized membrane protein